MEKIHSTAIVSPKAKLGKNIVVDPYAIIYDDVEIGDDCYIGPHTVVYNGARIGNKVKIYQGCSVSNNPQDLKFGNENSYFQVGDNCTIREFVTLHRGTGENGISKIGKNCLLMAYTHVAHDCSLGNNVILANSVQIGGHAVIEDYAIIGGSTPVHQFSHVGQHSMIGGGLKITSDVPPYVLAGGEPLRYAGLNSIGLRRRGFSNEDLVILKDTYKLLYYSGFNFSQAKEKIAEKYPNNVHAKNVIDFLNNSKRGIIKR